MKKNNRLVYLLGTSVLGQLAFAQLALAQSPSAAIANNNSDVEAVEAIVVTGSRIQNPGFTSPTPLTVLGSEQFKRTTPTSADDIVNTLPAFRPTTGVNQGTRATGLSTGQAQANLRGLGGQRTLVLVDGDRYVPTNAAGTMDLGIIPVELIDRVDVVTGGASAAYGSDAVAGVTNFVLKKRIDGLTGSIVGGISQRGDNEEFGISVASGHSFFDDRLDVVAGLDYNTNKGVGNIYSRKWSSVEPGNSGGPINFGNNRPAGMPAFGWANGVEYATQTPGGVINSAITNTGAPSSVLNQLKFNQDGSVSPLVRGPVYGNLMINSSSNPIATPLAQWLLKEPLDRLAMLGKATYQFTDDMSGYISASFADVDVHQISQYHQTPDATILATNPYLSPSVRSLLTTNNIRQFQLGRVDTDWPGSTILTNYRTLQIFTGLQGKLFDRFSWSASYGFGQSTTHGTTTGTKEANLAAALYAVTDASGNIVCGPIATNPNFAANKITATITPAFVQPGCVPLNPFGVANSTAAARDYVTGLQYTTNLMSRHAASINLSGSLFELPAGPLTFATGYEYRHDGLKQSVDALAQLGIYSNGNAKAFKGSNDVNEGYIEVDVPLLKGLPGVESLGLNAAARRTDYAISGKVTTWKVGGTYEPISGLRFRVTRSHDIRAPSLTDLYSVGGVSQAGSFTNPFNGVGGRLPNQASGNPDLTPEIGNTFAVGVSYQAKDGLFAGLNASVDYYKIKMKDVIASVGGGDSVERCYQGLKVYCSAITFDNTAFGIALVKSQPFNQALLEAEGVDISVGYRSSLDGIGLLGSIILNTYVSHLKHLTTTDRPPPVGVTVENAGYRNGAPKWQGSTFISYVLDDLTVGMQVKAFSKIGHESTYVGPDQPGYSPTLPRSINQNNFPSLVYFNLNGSYDFEMLGGDIQAFVNINNLLDKDPPQFAIAAINSGGNPYDYVGRTFKAGVRFRF